MRRLVVISGAGLSVESGIRAFRTDSDSGQALWDSYPLEEVCNIHAFRGEFYDKTHEFYNKRRQELKDVEPNLAHLRIAEWYKRYPGQVKNLTTNVDDLLERAGVPNSDIIHVHGYLKEIVIENEAGSPKRVVDVGYESINPDDYGWCKPNVVFFGEVAPLYTEMYSLLDSLTVQDMVIIVGCSNTVIDFNYELLRSVRQGTKMIVVNPSVSYMEQESYDVNNICVFRTGAVDAFSNPAFIEMVEKHLEG